MAKFEDGSYSCTPGIALIAKVLAGRCTMRYTRAAVGKGHLEEGQSPKEVTEPPEYVMDANIAATTNPVNGECQVTVQINSSDVEHGFYATGVLLYANDPDEGDVPYTYLKLEDGPEWIRPSSSVIGKLAQFDLIAAVGDVDTVTAVIDPTVVMTSEAVDSRIEQHNSDPNAHAGAFAQHNNDSGAHAQLVANIIQTVTAATSAAILKEGVTLSAAAWSHLDPSENGFSWRLALEVEDAKAEHYPFVSWNFESLEIAKRAGVCSTVEAKDGSIEFLALERPTEDLACTLALLTQSGGGGSGGGGSGYVLPVATPYSLGGIKASDSIAVDGDGTAHAYAEVSPEHLAGTEDTSEMLDEVFGKNN